MKEYVYVVTVSVCDGYVPVSYVFHDERQALARYGKECDSQVGFYHSCYGFEPEHETLKSDDGGKCVVWRLKNHGDGGTYFTPEAFVSFRRVELK